MYKGSTYKDLSDNDKIKVFAQCQTDNRLPIRMPQTQKVESKRLKVIPIKVTKTDHWHAVSEDFQDLGYLS